MGKKKGKTNVIEGSGDVVDACNINEESYADWGIGKTMIMKSD